MVSKIAFLYLSSFAWGCLVLLPLVALREVGQGFYRFFGFTCVGLQTLALGLALYMGPAFDLPFHRSAQALALSLFLTLCFSTALKVRIRWFLWLCFALAAVSGAAALGLPWMDRPHPLFLVLHSLSSALLLGAATLAMMLGHWYLVLPKLSIEPLKRYSAGYILLTVWMAVQLGASYFLYGAVPGPNGSSPWMGEAVFILFRVSWGLLLPLGLSYWIWTTVKMRSTQSATGILYAAMVCTMMGEGMGIYLSLEMGIPF